MLYVESLTAGVFETAVMADSIATPRHIAHRLAAYRTVLCPEHYIDKLLFCHNPSIAILSISNY
ncbi:MAG TPA: hypothetical protein VND99_05315 [Candidatus Acidoferrales bacterium]|nr:hypothetical protein [Candidatus Acidoferrales bacterium]